MHKSHARVTYEWFAAFLKYCLCSGEDITPWFSAHDLREGTLCLPLHGSCVPWSCGQHTTWLFPLSSHNPTYNHQSFHGAG